MKSIHQILEVSNNLVDKSAEMAENDPYGFIITIVSVSVVFASLIILYFAYTLIGKVVNSKMVQPNQASSYAKGQQHPTAEETAAISLALQQRLDESKHDKESYVITIQRDRTQIVSSALAVQQSVSAMPATSSSITPVGPEIKGKNVSAPLPGVILSIKVKAGDEVKAGQTIAILEAMKMENDIQAEHDGIVQSVNVEKGDSVLEGTTIVTIL